MLLRRAPVAFALSLLAVACGSGAEPGTTTTESSSTSSGTGGSAPANHAPVWSDAPAAPVEIGQGQTGRIPFTFADEDGDTVVAKVTSSMPGLEAVSLEVAGSTFIELHPDYATSGSVPVDVSLDDGKGGVTTVKLTVDVKVLEWLPGQSWMDPAGPEAREHGALIVDDAGGQVFLFGGSGYSPYLEPFNDAWRYDVAQKTWSSVTPAGDVPEPGGSRRVAHVPGTKIAYMFGGYGGTQGATSYNDLHRVTIEGQGLTFKKLTQTGTLPPKRSLHAFAYDPGTQKFVLFGGAGSALYNDTWTMTLAGDTATWTKLAPNPKPTARYGFFYGFQPEPARLLVYSGAQGGNPINPATDTWAFDFATDTWAKLADALSPGIPPGRRNGCFIYDPSGPRLFVFGGTSDGMTTQPGLFAFDARPGKEKWTQLSLAGEAPLRSSGIGFRDATSGGVLLGFGNTATDVYRDWNVLGY